jgi:hypothetical protein
MKRVAAVIALLVALSVVATADARRKPTRHERAAIAAKFGMPGKCLKIWVSTVNRHWARMEFNGKKYEDPDCQSHAADGVVVLKRKHGKWRMVTAGSDFDCPVPKTPPRVVDDLRIPCYDH